MGRSKNKKRSVAGATPKLISSDVTSSVADGKGKGEALDYRSTPSSERLSWFSTLFPDAFVEGKVDVNKLRGLLGEAADTGPERYTFSWAGKRDSMQLLQIPSR